MLKDWNHDLIHQLSEVSDSLWRLDKFTATSKGCDRCTTLWTTLKNDYERHSKTLVEEIKRHITENRFE